MYGLYFIYCDESGNRDPSDEKRPIYVVAGLSLFEKQWHGFERTINRSKRKLMAEINSRTGQKFDLADCEIKSSWIRIPKMRQTSRFLSQLTDEELSDPC